MRIRIGRRWVAATALGLVAVLPAAGCAFDPSSVPMPGTTVPGPTYRVHIRFSSALNLPAKAKIMANGAQVGTVSAVSVVPPAAGAAGYVVVAADISKSVRLPVNTVAELRQDTVLGDIHVALTTPTDGFGALLADGGTIPLEHTKPPVQLEDTMAAVATFTQGGAVSQLQDIIGKLNAVLPRDPADTARISRTLGGDAVDLAAHLDQVDALLNGIASNAEVLHDIRPQLDDILSQRSVDELNGIAASVVGVAGIFGALGPVGASLAWLGPLLGSADGAVQAFVPLVAGARPLDLSRPSNLQALLELLRDRVIPFVEHGPKVNVTGIRTDDAAAVSTQDQTDGMVATLRMIGVVR
ncbi:MlaD family protein [Nocardia sp. alder85J]|uniref:MlaD family protein n=1 Tax=Nocardia sp. alder85J TaxID=2862949 RepID=UPI001CD2BC6C|nr:MlaD family protein [Nocardia sp. alder85J]MCX4092054.1 MlaD family protein [Nocardia sp. alder85J]